MRNPVNSDDGTEQVLRVMTVSSLEWTQGFEYVLMAIRHCLEVTRAIRLDIIAYGRIDRGERQRVLYTIEDLQLNGYVSLITCSVLEDVREQLWGAGAFISSSICDELSPLMMEAVSHGVPLITTDCSGAQEMVAAGVEALIVPIRNPDALAQAVCTLSTDIALRQRLGAASRKHLHMGPHFGGERLRPAAMSSSGTFDGR